MTRIPPSPYSVSSWQDWANQMLEYIQDSSPSQAAVAPRPVFLEHKIPSVPASAATDGILMYDPLSGEPVYSVNGEWKPMTSLTPIEYAEDIIREQYGVNTSVELRATPISKFGRNLTVGATEETVAEFEGTVANEAYVSTNLIDTVVSTSASDTMICVLIGFTIDGLGNLTSVSQDVTFAGTTPVPLVTPMARAVRMYVKPSGVFNAPQSLPVGNLYVYDNADATTARTKLMILAGNSQTEKCATCTSSTDYAFISEFCLGIGDSGNQTDVVTARIEARDISGGGVWRPMGGEVTIPPGENRIFATFNPLMIVQPNHDIRVVARTDAGTAEVYATVRGGLAGIVT